MLRRAEHSARPLVFLLLIMALGYLLLHSLAGGTLLAHSAYDSYALQAENWLAGRNYIAGGENCPWLELAIYQNRYYQSFPPVPGVFLLPLVAAVGAAAVPSNLVVALYGLLCAAGVYAFFARHGASAARCVFWAALVCMGSNFWWMSTNGGVWFQAQVLNLVLVVWGMYFASGITVAQHTAAAFLLALSVGCRPFSILLLVLYLGHLLAQQCGLSAGPDTAGCRTEAKSKWKAFGHRLSLPGAGFWLPLLAALSVGICLAGYNYARFGSITEFGHTYLPEFQRLQNGQFALSYFVANLKNLLRPVTLSAELDLRFPIFNGFLPFVANPVFLLAAAALVQKVWQKRFSWRDGVLWLCGAAGLFALCLHETLGGWQFGARYTVDLIPYAMLGLCPVCAESREAADPHDGEWLLCAAAVLFNLYGAVYMLLQ